MEPKEKLLSSEEITACKKISTKDDIDGKRAKGLLALNQGATQVQAGEQSGLTKQQVKYLVRIFRQKRLGIFSADREVKKEATAEEGLKVGKKTEVKKKKKKDKKKGKKTKDKKCTCKKQKDICTCKDKKKKGKKKKDKKKKDISASGGKKKK
jgi:hypothetical protein